jgi:Uma2 family endonuclease
MAKSLARVARFQGAVNMSVAEVLTHPPTHWLDGVPPDKRVVIVDVTWDHYESLVEHMGESRNCRVAFDGKDIEMMTLGPFHERQKSLLDLFIMIVAGELKIERQPMGSTTWKRKKLKRAIESDVCYYFDRAKLAAAAAAAESDNIDVYPNPDLAAEVGISPPKIDRPGIYAALHVQELWRVRNKVVSIEQLGPDGTYVPVARSRFLPVRAEDVTRWIFSEDSSSLVAWEARLRQWVRDQLVPEAGG